MKRKNELINDLIACSPCLACGALPGEPCITLYSKDGRGKAGQPFIGHHMVRCYLWHKLREIRDEKPHMSGWFNKPKRGLYPGCYYDVTNLDRELMTAEHAHGSNKLKKMIQSDNLKKAMTRF